MQHCTYPGPRGAVRDQGRSRWIDLRMIQHARWRVGISAHLGEYCRTEQ